jgi:hypothetical protein
VDDWRARANTNDELRRSIERSRSTGSGPGIGARGGGGLGTVILVGVLIWVGRDEIGPWLDGLLRTVGRLLE